MRSTCQYLLSIPLLILCNTAEAFSVENGHINRKSFLTTVVGGIIVSPLPSNAKASGPTAQDEINTIREASDTLNVLLENWEKATVECIFADVPRELLESKNKEQLLEKASTFALFDKSTSVVSCKKTNKIVRDYIGVTGKGPMVNIDKRMLKRNVVDFLDPDDLDVYFSEVESFQGAISRAAAASYAAGMSDLDSVNNFEKGTQQEDGDSNLDQARKAIEDARVSIGRIVSFLDKSER